MIYENSRLMLAVFDDDTQTDGDLDVPKRLKSDYTHVENRRTSELYNYNNKLPENGDSHLLGCSSLISIPTMPSLPCEWIHRSIKSDATHVENRRKSELYSYKNKLPENSDSVLLGCSSLNSIPSMPSLPCDWIYRSIRTGKDCDHIVCANHKKKKKNVQNLNKHFADLCIDKLDEWSVISKKDTDGDSLLFVAIILLQTQTVKMMINLAPSYDQLNTANKLYQTALHLAALTGNHAVARRLLVAGAKVDERDIRLNTPLHIAVAKGFKKVADVLMKPVTYLETKQNMYEIPYQKIPQNLELYNADGFTCLHIAGNRTDKHMIDLLLVNDADINARELKSGKTILHFFAESDNLEMVKYIISKCRININTVMYCGLRAADVAYSRGYFSIAYLLLSSGGSNLISDTTATDSDTDSE